MNGTEALYPRGTLPLVTHPAPEQSRRSRYVLVTKDGVDTIHRDPREECNLDDTYVDTEIDVRTAAVMIADGKAQPCGHCVPDRVGE